MRWVLCPCWGLLEPQRRRERGRGDLNRNPHRDIGQQSVRAFSITLRAFEEGRGENTMAVMLLPPGP